MTSFLPAQELEARPRATCLLAVEDTGHGIEPEHLPHLFERFYRTDWARVKDSGGTGLGLPIVKEIAEAHGGSVSVTSQVEKGSVFSLHLPARTQQITPALPIL